MSPTTRLKLCAIAFTVRSATPRRILGARLLLVLAPVLLLFLVIVLVILRIFGGVFDRLGGRQRLAFSGFAFGGFQFAHAPVIFPGVEHQVQPRNDLFDRRQWAGRTGFAARTRRALRAGLALIACFAACALSAGFALRTRFAALALRSRLAWRASFAARTFGSGSSGMALRAGASGFTGLAAQAGGTLSSLPG